MDKWDNRFIDLAAHVATWSKDPSTKVGAVIVDENRRIVSVGYNGFPAGVNDAQERYDNREIKYEMIIHGEINAILFANRDLHNCTLYTWPFMPCSRCASIVTQKGISRVVAPVSNDKRWEKSFNLSKEIFNEAKVKLDLL
jgi:dCMP deaminase